MCRLMCRFSDAGNDDLTTRSDDRRPKTCTGGDLSTRSKPQLVDDLVGQLLKMQGHVEAKRLGGLQVDDQLELGG